MASLGLVKGARVHIIAPPHNSKKAIQSGQTFDQVGVITREGSSANGGWFEILLDVYPQKRVYYRRGSLRVFEEDNLPKEVDEEDQSSLSEEPTHPSDSETSPGLSAMATAADLDVDDDANSMQDMDLGLPATSHIVRRRPRKPQHPFRSVRFGYDMLIQSAFCYHSLAPPVCMAELSSLGDDSKSSAGSPSYTATRRRRKTSSSGSPQQVRCDSCNVNHSPYWHKRHSNPLGAILCNACGLRYKKYKRACQQCCYVPRRDEQDADTCVRCAVRLAKGKSTRRAARVAPYVPP